MSENLIYPFKSRNNFKNEYFYYFLPYEINRYDIGVQIKKYEGVKIYYLFFKFFLVNKFFY